MRHGAQDARAEMRTGFDFVEQVGEAVTADGGDTIVIPDAELLFQGQYARSGRDLVLTGEDGERFTVHDYFAHEKRATLTSPAGEVLSGEVVELLAGPANPGEYAQATPAPAPAAAPTIGKVQVTTGSATVLRNGVTVQLNVGDAVYKSDVVQTGGDSSVGISFTDGTVLNLSANARMALTEYVYVPNGSANASLLSIVQGTFTFVAGQVAKTGDMKIATPVATLGIRGTTGGGQEVTLGTVQAQIGATTYQFFLRQDFNPDGTPSDQLGAFDIYSNTGALVARHTGTGTYTVVSQGVGQAPTIASVAISGDQSATLQALFQQLFQSYSQSLQNPAQINPQGTKYAGSSTALDLLRDAFGDALGIPILIGFNVPFADIGVNPGALNTMLAEFVVAVNTPPAVSVSPIIDTEAVPGSSVSFLIGDRVIIVDPDISNPDFNDQPTPYVPGSAALQSVIGPSSLPPGVDLAALVTIDPATGQVSYDTQPFTFLAGNESVVYVISFQVRSGPDTITQTLTLTINGLNEAPAVTPIVEGATEDGPVEVINLLSTASDSDFNNVLSVTNLTVVDENGHSVAYTLLADGFTISIDPTQFNSLAEGETLDVNISYQVIDGFSATPNTAQLVITGINDAPVANDDAFSVDEDGTLIIPAPGLLGNDSDVDGDLLSALLEVESGPSHGQLFLNLDGSFTYVPDADFNGEDSFSYYVNDGSADSNIATVSIAVGEANDAPVAADDAYLVHEDGSLKIDFGAGVLANDTDTELDSLFAALVDGPDHGSLVFNDDGSFTYTPDANYNGSDSFTYRASDGTDDSNAATVNITVASVDDTPTGGGTVFLTVDEDALDLVADPGDLQAGAVTGSNAASSQETATASGGISFTAGEEAINVGFANPAGPGWSAPAVVGLAAGYAISWALSAGQLVGTLFQGAVNLGNAIYLSLSGQTSAAAFASATPTVTATLTDQLQHAAGADALTISGLQVVATDAGGSAALGALNLTIGDDVPAANPSFNEAFEASGVDTNLMLVIDLSASMTTASGVAGLSRIDLLKASVHELLEHYNNLGDVAVRVVTFSSTGDSGDAWLSVAQAKTLISGLVADGNSTDYDAALAATRTGFAGSGKIDNAQNVSYFLSDGNPTVGGGITGAEATAWQNFVNTNEIASLAVGLGSGVEVSSLDPIAYDGRGVGTNTDGIVVEDLSQLANALVATIPQPVSSNILSDGLPQSSFGADGGYVRSIKLGDITYTYDRATDTVSDGNGPLTGATFDSATNVLTIANTVSGTLAIDMDDAAYTYTAPGSISGNQTVIYEFTLIDGDGDTDTDTLAIALTNVDAPPIVRDDLVITNVAGSSIVIPQAALLANDNEPDTQPIVLTQVMNGAGGSVVLNAGSVTFTDQTPGGPIGGTFTYVGEAGGRTDVGTVTFDHNPGAELSGTGLGEILIGRNGAPDAISGLAGNDVLIGGSGNDQLSGGAGSDRFLFQAGSGQDTITDFALNQDLIELIGIPGITNFDQLTFSSQGNGVLVQLDGGNSIFVQNVTVANLESPSNFLIHA